MTSSRFSRCETAKISLSSWSAAFWMARRVAARPAPMALLTPGKITVSRSGRTGRVSVSDMAVTLLLAGCPAGRCRRVCRAQPVLAGHTALDSDCRGAGPRRQAPSHNAGRRRRNSRQCSQRSGPPSSGLRTTRRPRRRLSQASRARSQACAGTQTEPSPRTAGEAAAGQPRRRRQRPRKGQESPPVAGAEQAHEGEDDLEQQEPARLDRQHEEQQDRGVGVERREGRDEHREQESLALHQREAATASPPPTPSPAAPPRRPPPPRPGRP